MSQKPLDVSQSKAKFDEFYEFEAPQFFDFSEPELHLESESTDVWFSTEHPLHSPRAMRQLKMRSERTQAAASSKLRFTPKRVFGAAAPVVAVAAPPPSPVRASPVRQVAKKLTFPSPAPAGEMSRKRGAESAVRVVGSGPFSEARQKRAARALVLEDTESSQPDMVTAAAVTVAPARAPEPFDASARRLLFQLSPSGHTLVTVPRRAASPAAPQPDIFAELERLTISSGGKEAPSRKRTLVATPPRALRAAAGGPARVVAFPAPEEQAEEAPVKRGRTAPQTAAGANILSKMAPAASRVGGSAATRSVRAAPAASAPGTAPAGARAARNVSVEDIVLWEKRTGRVWQRLSASEKAAELHGLKCQENIARFNF